MGLGIAQVLASAGFQTLVYDIQQDALDRAKTQVEKQLQTAVEKGKMTQEQQQETWLKLSFSSDFSAVVADFLIEAILEDLEVKTELFQRLANQNESNAILATNTSTIPITRLAAKVSHPERVVGMHFFNPAHLMKLVEVIAGAATSDEVIETTMKLAEQLGKSPIRCADSPGFVVNRVARPFYLEALKLVEEGSLNFSQIDSLMEGLGFKMGPFKLIDLIGVEVNHRNSVSVWEQFMLEDRFRPSKLQQRYVDAGFWGRKTGRGFYPYSDAT